MAPSPLLYTASPIVPDQQENEEVSAKLTVEVADRTLGLIEEVLESGKASAQKKVKKSTRTRDSVKEWIKSSSISVLLLLSFLAVLISGVVDVVQETSECALLDTRVEHATILTGTDLTICVVSLRVYRCMLAAWSAVSWPVLCQGRCSFLCYSNTDRPSETRYTLTTVIEYSG